jgi:hypothetical protein
MRPSLTRLLSSLLLLCGLGAFAACQSSGDDDGGLGQAGRPNHAGSGGVILGQGGKSGAGGTAGSGTSGSSGSGAGSGGTSPGAGGEGGDASGTCETLAGLDECGGTRVEATRIPVNLLLVIDKSGSMTDQPSGFGTSKWEAMKEALGTAVTNAPPTVATGLVLYPFATTSDIPLECDGAACCAVPDGGAAVLVGVAPNTAKLLSDTLAQAEPGGGTPTAAALERALQYFTEGDGVLLEGEKYVLLATDGGPNCNEDITCDADTCTPNLDGAPQCAAGNCCEGAGEFCVDDGAVTQQIAALESAGIRTFVVGIPGTEEYADYLDAFARAGGVPNQGGSRDYFAVSGALGVTGLTGVLTNITTALVTSCEITLAEQPAQISLVNVAIDCEALEKEGDDGSGWEFDDPTNPHSVIVHGPACDDLKANGARRVDVVYGCTTIR